MTVEKAPFGIFSAETDFSCICGAGGEICKETLLRKASEPTAHVAGFGTRVGGLRPSDTSHGFIENLKPDPEGSGFLVAIVSLTAPARCAMIKAKFRVDEQRRASSI